MLVTRHNHRHIHLKCRPTDISILCIVTYFALAKKRRLLIRPTCQTRGAAKNTMLQTVIRKVICYFANQLTAGQDRQS